MNQPRAAIATSILAGFMALPCPAAASDALVLGFAATDTLKLVSLSTADRFVPRPVRAAPGWSATATDPSGVRLWTQTIPAPRAFHTDPSAQLTFSVVVPHVIQGSRITILDERGEPRWSRVIEQADVAKADAARATINRDVDAAYAATARLRSATLDAQQLPHSREREDAGVTKRRASPTPNEAPPAKGIDAARSAASPSGSGHVVSGHVAPGGPLIVRAFDAADNRFIVSTEQDWATARFELALPTGTYVFEVDDNVVNSGSAYFYRAPTRTAPIRIAGDTQLPEIIRDNAQGEFVLRAQIPCALFPPNQGQLAWIDVWTGNGTHLQRSVGHEPPSSDGASDLCEVRYGIHLSPGSYAIEASPAGWEPRRWEGVQIADGQRVERSETFALAERSHVWRGTVVNAAQQPMPGLFMLAYDQQQDTTFSWLSTDANGQFEFAYRKGWTVEFEPLLGTASESSVRRLHAMDGSPLPSTVVIDDIDLQAELEDGLLRVYGNGNRSDRFNILFLADGYADVRESYTDSNANGTWDGIVWHDFDHDGVFGGSDTYAAYGSPPEYPESGSIPTAHNEPLADLNGDGVPSFDDASLFLINARGFLRSFFGSDFWNGQREAFNAYALFEPSAQAGYRVVSASGEELIARSTRYGATLDQTRGLVSVDRIAAVNRALAVLPEVDMVIVLVNQPIRDGRGPVALSQPGSMVYLPGPLGNQFHDMTPSHEMGHFIGSLCDEYSEFTGVHPLNGTGTPWCPNASYSTHRADIPWANWLFSDADVLTRNLDGSLGIYEGADYYPGGAYRPSLNSTMRYLSPLFNAPSRAALEQAMHARTGDPATLQTRPPAPAFSRIRKARPL